jgi:hypothetical protein
MGGGLTAMGEMELRRDCCLLEEGEGEEGMAPWLLEAPSWKGAGVGGGRRRRGRRATKANRGVAPWRKKPLLPARCFMEWGVRAEEAGWSTESLDSMAVGRAPSNGDCWWPQSRRGRWEVELQGVAPWERGRRELGVAAGRRPWRSFCGASKAGEVELASMEEEGQGTPWLAEGRSSCALEEEEEAACARRLKEKRGRDGCGG